MLNLSLTVLDSRFPTSKCNPQLKLFTFFCIENKMVSILMWSWPFVRFWVGPWEEWKQRFEKPLWPCVWGCGRASGTKWLPLPEDLLQGWQHHLCCITAVTNLKQYEQWPVCIVRWGLQVTPYCGAQIQNLEEQTLTLLIRTLSLPSSLFILFLSLKLNVLFFLTLSPFHPHSSLCSITFLYLPSTLTWSPALPCLAASLTRWENI